jgi:hypothetical protein
MWTQIFNLQLIDCVDAEPSNRKGQLCEAHSAVFTTQLLLLSLMALF